MGRYRGGVSNERVVIDFFSRRAGGSIKGSVLRMELDSEGVGGLSCQLLLERKDTGPLQIGLLLGGSGRN